MSIDLSIDYKSPESVHGTSAMGIYFLRHNPDAVFQSQFEAFSKPGALAGQLSGYVIRVEQNNPGGRGKNRARSMANNQRQVVTLEVYDEYGKLINDPSQSSK